MNSNEAAQHETIKALLKHVIDIRSITNAEDDC